MRVRRNRSPHALAAPHRPTGAGHTLVELLVVLALLPLLLSLSYEALAAAHRFYRHQAQRAESRETTRIAVEVLAAELRAAGPADLYAIATDSVALRSTVGFGFVCEVRGNRLTLWRTSGIFVATPTDSVLVFVERDAAITADDTVATARILAVAAGAAGTCPGGGAGERRLIVEPPVPTTVRVGAPLRAFRPYVYRVYQGRDRRWWLGQRLRGGTIQPIAGPLAPPGRGGLRLRLLDAMGRPVTRLGEGVGARVGVRSLVRRRTRRGPPFLSDSLEVRVELRNR